PSTSAAPPSPSPLSLHDALPILPGAAWRHAVGGVLLLPALCLATDVRVVAVTPGRSADVVIERGAPVTIEVGETVEGVKLLRARSEEHTSELQSRFDLVCRLLLE